MARRRAPQALRCEPRTTSEVCTTCGSFFRAKTPIPETCVRACRPLFRLCCVGVGWAVVAEDLDTRVLGWLPDRRENARAELGPRLSRAATNVLGRACRASRP